jgi:RNA polymerase sigma-70 factor (ECF subfamily)
MIAMYLTMIDNIEDKNKFENLYLLYRQDMYAVAYNILHNSYDAEDAVHQAFLRIAKNIDKILEINCPKTKAYVVIIVRNVSFNIYGKNKKNSNLSIDTSIGNILEDNSLLNELDYKALLDKISSLPDIYKDVLFLKYVQGYNNDEISLLLDISKDAICKRVQRARTIIREDLSYGRE